MEYAAMTMWAEQLPLTTGAALIFKFRTALLISFAATLALLHAEIYFSDLLIMQDFMSIVF